MIDPEDMALTFNISLPEVTSVNSDDVEYVNEVHYALYSCDENNIAYVLDDEAAPIVKDTMEFTDGCKIEIGLSGGSKGEFVLIAWASAKRQKGEGFYDLSDLRHIRCSENQALSNIEARAAYYKTHRFTIDSETCSEDIVLSRPHARINLGTFAEALKRPDGTTLRLGQSSVSIKGVSTEFNTVAGISDPQTELYGKAGAETSEPYEFALNEIPDGNIVINEKEYPYLALNYFFVTGSVEMEFIVTGIPYRLVEGVTEGEMVEQEGEQVTFEGKLSGINAQQDWTTNIVGYFFGADGRFEYDFRLSLGEEKDGSIVIGDEDGDGFYDEPMDFWWGDFGGDDDYSGGGNLGGGDEYVDPDIGGGDGTITDPDKEKENNRIETPDAVTWEVYTANGLLMWAEEVRNSTTTQRINLKLFDDIYLKDEWVPVRTASEDNYYGSIDGQGHAIYDMTINNPEGYNIGFLSRTSQDDEIQVANLNFHNVSIIGGERVGVVAGTGHAIYNCIVHSGSVQGNEMVGGILGCIIADRDRATRQCTNYASVSGNTYVGGLVGGENSRYTNLYLYDCKNYGDVTAVGDYAGGICGQEQIYAVGCENYGDVTGYDHVGGIIPRSITCRPEECLNKGNVIGNNYVGGITGEGTMKQCINHGNVTGVDYVGGLTGRYKNGGLTDSSTNYGNIEGVNYVGGCAGYLKSEYSLNTSNIQNHGMVKGTTSVGGVAGYAASTGSGKSGTISQIHNSGEVVGDENVGGLIGRLKVSYASSSMTFTGSSTSGTVKGKTAVGQLYGLADGNGTITDDGTNVCTGEVVIVE